MARSRILLASSLFFVVLLLGPAPRSWADPFEEARKTFAEAETLYAAKKYDDAADKYETTYRLMRSPLLFFNIAQAKRLNYQKSGNHKDLIAARDNYQRFLAEAQPAPKDKTRAEDNLKQVETLSMEEAKKRFNAAEQAMKMTRYEAAVNDYEAAYELSKRPALLFNLAQALRKQFSVDNKLDHLARAESLLQAFKRDNQRQVKDEVIEDILAQIQKQRAEYERRVQAEAQAHEPAAMREARQLYQNGDGAGALAALARAEESEDNPRVVLQQIYRLRGQAAALAGKDEQAVQAFQAYLAIEPAADGTGLRDTALPAFQQAREFWQKHPAMKLEHLAPGRVPPGQPVIVPVKIESDPLDMVARSQFYYRRRGESNWQNLDVADGKPARLPVMPMPLVGKQYQMEYYLVALNQFEGHLDEIGTPNAPLTFLVTEDAIIKPPPIYKRWWFWAATGAVVAGAITTYAIMNDDGLPDSNITGDVSQGLGGIR